MNSCAFNLVISFKFLSYRNNVKKFRKFLVLHVRLIKNLNTQLIIQFVKRKLSDNKLSHMTETIRVQDPGMYKEVHKSFISEETRKDGSRAGSSRHKEDEGRKRPATEEQPAGQNRSQTA